MNYCTCAEPEPIYEQDNDVLVDGRVALHEQGGWFCEICQLELNKGEIDEAN